jgi:hypothetical protein
MAKLSELEPGISEIFLNPKYLKGTEVCMMLAMFFYMAGVPVIPIVSNAVFSKTNITPNVGV